MKDKQQQVKITRKTAEEYISLMLRKDILLSEDKWNDVCEIMEDGCREVLNDVAHDIHSEIEKSKFNFYRN